MKQPLIQTRSGPVSGLAEGGLLIYKGIPFAAPPVGDLRWKSPQPPKPWTDVRPCTRFGPWCPQPAPIIGGPLGPTSEDCLYLNIWTLRTEPPARLPVMIWIHGGGYTTGSGAAPFYDGAALARMGVVLVTINYRLGPLGFLAHPLLSKEDQHGVSGNYGLLDQIAALQWVRDNIAAFGGDPGCVTIFGESAGAGSVARLMVSPLATGLFHRAIAESGGPVGQNRHLREGRGPMPSAESVGEQVAQRLGCDKAPDVLAAMRAKSPDEILAAATPSQGLFGKGLKFAPVVDGYVLPDDAAVLFQAGRLNKVPLLAGTNANEGTMFLAPLPIKHVLGYRLFVRIYFGSRTAEALALLPCESDEEVPAALDRLVTLTAFVQPARLMVRSVAASGRRAYLYQFTRQPPLEKVKQLGAFHGLEIAYVFGTLRLGAGFTEADRSLSKAMMAYWVNFARTGDPNGPGLVPWPAYDEKSDASIEFGDEVRAASGLYKKECDLIDDVQAAPKK